MTDIYGGRASRRVLLVIGWATLVALLTLVQTVSQVTSERLAAVSLALFVLGLVSISWVQERGIWSPPSAFFAVLGVFHVGLAPYWIFDWDPKFVRPTDYKWFEGMEGNLALWLVTYSMAAFVIGATLVSSSVSSLKKESEQDADNASRLALAGAFVLIAGIALWLIRVVAASGLQILTGSYGSFLTQTAGSNLWIAYQLIGLGLGLCALAPARRRRVVRIALMAFAAFAVLAFFLGLRGEVLFPVAVAATVRAANHKMPRARFVLLGAAILLCLTSGAQSVRAIGVANYELNAQQFNPLAGIAELGTTVRVVAHTVSWHEHNGEPYYQGSTYTVAIARAFESIPPRTRPPAQSDFRLFNSEIAARSGAIGGSVVGEAYHNFGGSGVVGVLLLLGGTMARFGALRSYRSLAAYVCVAVPLFNHIRNSFVPVLPSIAVGLALVLAFDALLRRNSSEPQSQTHDQLLENGGRQVTGQIKSDWKS